MCQGSTTPVELPESPILEPAVSSPPCRTCRVLRFADTWLVRPVYLFDKLTSP